MTKDTTARFAALVAGPAPELDEAVLLVAASHLPGLSIEEQKARLDELAVGVSEPSPVALIEHLTGEVGFRGDRSSYHDAANSLLPLVLDRRQGIPLSLSIVAIEVGRRCGVPLHGIGMPGHFLVASAERPGEFVDLYGGGRVLDRGGCRAVFTALHPRGRWLDDYLEPVGTVAMVTRLVANLTNAYRRSGEREQLAHAIELRLRLPGATERDRRELAMVLGSSGRYDDAATVLEGSDASRDQTAAARLRARLN